MGLSSLTNTHLNWVFFSSMVWYRLTSTFMEFFLRLTHVPRAVLVFEVFLFLVCVQLQIWNTILLSTIVDLMTFAGFGDSIAC
jgi:hypothetical protein